MSDSTFSEATLRVKITNGTNVTLYETGHRANQTIHDGQVPQRLDPGQSGDYRFKSDIKDIEDRVTYGIAPQNPEVWITLKVYWDTVYPDPSLDVDYSPVRGLKAQGDPEWGDNQWLVSWTIKPG